LNDSLSLHTDDGKVHATLAENADWLRRELLKASDASVATIKRNG
jgi:hypothetical protein